MSWDRIKATWGIVMQRWGRRRQRRLDKKRLAEWIAREHKTYWSHGRHRPSGSDR